MTCSKKIVVTPNDEAAIEVDLTIEQWSSWPFEIFVEGENLTGATFKLQARDSAGAVVFEVSNGNSKIALDAAAGKFTGAGASLSALSATETGALSFVSLFYDGVLTRANGSRRRLIRGLVSLSLGVAH